MVLKGVIWVHNDKIGSYGLERSNWVHNDKIGSNGLERSQIIIIIIIYSCQPFDTIYSRIQYFCVLELAHLWHLYTM